MFDILFKIFDLILKSGRYYEEKQKQVRKKEFGQALVTCYFRILETTDSALNIVAELESAARRYRRHKVAKEGNLDFSSEELIKLLRKQSLNIIRLGHASQKIKWELELLSPDISRNISELIEGKTNIVFLLSEMLASDWYLFDVTIVDDKFVKDWWNFIMLKDPSHGIHKLIDAESFKEQFLKKLEGHAFCADNRWDMKVCETIEIYLKNFSPRDDILKLRNTAKDLREILTKNFNLDDILWHIDKFEDYTDVLF